MRDRLIFSVVCWPVCTVRTGDAVVWSWQHNEGNPNPDLSLREVSLMHVN